MNLSLNQSATKTDEQCLILRSNYVLTGNN